MSPVGQVRTTTDHNGVEYRYRVIGEGAARIERCNAEVPSVEIPDTLDGFEVVSLGEGSFSNLRSVEAVHCGRCLKHIGDKAFFGCSRLKELMLNDGLESLGSDAFGMCFALPCLNIPASVRELGQAPATTGIGAFSKVGMAINIAADNEYLFNSPDGAVYRRDAQGFTLIDATRVESDRLVLKDGTRAVAPRACTSNGSIAEVVLPEGLREIGEEAFCGCSKLRVATLPESLESLGDYAFSFTALAELAIPANLTRFGDYAFSLGHAQRELRANPYQSSLRRITVAADNPALVMRGPVLCRRVAGGLDAIACIGSRCDVALGREVVSVADAAFAGSPSINELRLHEGIRFAASGLLPHALCKRLVIDRPDASQVDLEIPSGQGGHDLLAASLTAGSIDVELLLSNYDAAIAAEEHDQLTQARQMVARLAAPTCLAAEHAAAFSSRLAANLTSIVAHFGARSYWKGLSELFDAGIINEDNVAEQLSVLTQVGDTTAAAYVLQLKNERFGRPDWDYEL